MEVGGESGWGRRNDGWTCGGTFVHVKGAEKDPSDCLLRPDVRTGALPFYETDRKQQCSPLLSHLLAKSS
jgi:hypothetical protein